MKIGIGVLLMVLSAQATEMARDVLKKATVSIQASEMLSIDIALQAFNADTGQSIRQGHAHYPRNDAEFERALTDYFEQRNRDITRDRWGEKYIYTPRGPLGYDLVSKGPDQQLGTDDDLILERRETIVRINKDPEQIALQAIEQVERVHAEQRARLREALDQLEAAELEEREQGNNGVGNGQDPTPGNAPENDGAGTSPGNPGNQGGTPGSDESEADADLRGLENALDQIRRNLDEADQRANGR